MKLQNLFVILLLVAILVVLIGAAYFALFPRWSYLVFEYDNDLDTEVVSQPFCQEDFTVCRIADPSGLPYYLNELGRQGYEMISGGLVDAPDLRYSFTFRRRG